MSLYEQYSDQIGKMVRIIDSSGLQSYIDKIGIIIDIRERLPQFIVLVEDKKIPLMGWEIETIEDYEYGEEKEEKKERDYD